jgi:hypothetical protein
MSNKDTGGNQMNQIAMLMHHFHAEECGKTFDPCQELKKHTHWLTTTNAKSEKCNNTRKLLLEYFSTIAFNHVG